MADDGTPYESDYAPATPPADPGPATKTRKPRASASPQLAGAHALVMQLERQEYSPMDIKRLLEISNMATGLALGTRC